MYRKLPRFLAAVVLAAMFNVPVQAAVIHIDFDTTPLGPIAAGQFAGLGVTFTNASVADVPPFFTTPTRSIFSTSGGVEFLAADAVGASFTVPVSSVSINGINVGFDGLRLEAYDASNNLLAFDQVFGTTEGGTAGGGAGEIFTLTVSDPLIARVSIFQAVNDPALDTIVLDDFRFTVPEPSTLTLLGIILAGLGFRRLRSRA
jgi:hypothetical protein